MVVPSAEITVLMGSTFSRLFSDRLKALKKLSGSWGSYGRRHSAVALTTAECPISHDPGRLNDRVTANIPMTATSVSSTARMRTANGIRLCGQGNGCGTQGASAVGVLRGGQQGCAVVR